MIFSSNIWEQRPVFIWISYLLELFFFLLYISLPAQVLYYFHSFDICIQSNLWGSLWVSVLCERALLSRPTVHWKIMWDEQEKWSKLTSSYAHLDVCSSSNLYLLVSSLRTFLKPSFKKKLKYHIFKIHLYKMFTCVICYFVNQHVSKTFHVHGSIDSISYLRVSTILWKWKVTHLKRPMRPGFHILSCLS